VLERVVTGSVNGSAQRAVPVALDVVDGREMEWGDTRTLSSILDGSVPGIWVWEQSPTSLLARYASIRGASSFGISYPKVYVDGIEVANSLLVTELNGQWLPREDIGVQLRSFWREYPGVNRLRASASYDLRRTLSFVISAENLLDHQLGEPDNVTVLPGRTITAACARSSEDRSRDEALERLLPVPVRVRSDRGVLNEPAAHLRAYAGNTCWQLGR
jgi:hypothetical protein